MCQLRDRLNLPIFIVPPYASRGTAGIKEFTTAGLPAFNSFERAARAISATSSYHPHPTLPLEGGGFGRG
jgi:hypothetical protein